MDRRSARCKGLVDHAGHVERAVHLGISLGTQEQRGIRHNLKVEVQEIGVPAVAHQAKHLAFPDSIAGFHPDRAVDYVGIAGIFPVPYVNDDEIYGQGFRGPDGVN